MTRNTAATDRKSDSNSNVGRRRFIEATGAGAVATALAGCLPDGSDSGDGSGGTGGDTPADGNQTTSGDGGSETPSGPDGNMKIGVLAPSSGDIGFIGRGAFRSAQLAATEVNSNGVMGQEVEIIQADTQSSPNAALGETRTLVEQENVDLIVGTYVSEVTQTIIDYIAEFDVPFIVTGSAAPTIVTDFIGQDYERYKNFFRTGPINSYHQAEAQANYADYLNERHGWTSYGFAADNASWTEPFSEVLPGMLEEKGYTVDYEERLSISTTNFRPILDDLESAGVDAVFRFFAHISAGEMLGQWHTFDYPFAMEGIHVTSMLPEFFELADGYPEYETTSQGGAGGVAPITEKTQPFQEAYASEYQGQESPGAHPMYMGFNTYDAIIWWAEVARQAGTWDHENYIDDLVDTALETEIAGTAGQISVFGPDAEYPHDCIPGTDDDGNIVNYPVTQWRGDGTIECVYPREFATGEHYAPNWM